MGEGILVVTMIDFPSYPKVHALGHREIADLLKGQVVVQEKYDGSQINWRWDRGGALHVKSKGGWQLGGPEDRVQPDKLFQPAIDHLLTLDPHDPELVFRGETIATPRHNTLTYSRVPAGKIVLFDVVTPGWEPHYGGDYAGSLGVEYAKELAVEFPGEAVNPEVLDSWLKTESSLGGQLIEGVVIKNYNRFGLDGKPLMGKYVSEAFKEKHSREWKQGDGKDAVQAIIESLNTEARFAKAVQHLFEAGELEGSPRDIGKLMVEVKRDVLDEERDWITERLVTAFMPTIARAIGRGLPEYYKQLLMERQFEGLL